MRPGSRGSGFGSGGGNNDAPPGTGMRPGSGRKPPGTGQRLRTGVTTGVGTEAAQGFALNASVNVKDRPVTGQGVMGMKMQVGGGRIVEDTSYYVGLLRKKMTDVGNETRKLRAESEQFSKDTAQYSQLEKRYETLLKNKETLEGQLADYNLALDKTRSSTDPDDVSQLAMHLAEKNRVSSQDLDRLLMMRKSKEQEIMQVEDQVELLYRSIQSRINELEPGKLRSYNDSLSKQKEIHERIKHYEDRINEINFKINSFEGDSKSSSYRKEYSNLEKKYQLLRQDVESLQEELEIANLDPKEAHTKFVARVNHFKQSSKVLDDKIVQMNDDIKSLRKNLEDIENNKPEDNGDAAKMELLQKRDEEMTSFMDKFEENRNSILKEQREAKDIIVALLEHMGRGIDESNNIVTQEAYGEMEEAKTFKEKNLATAQKTMDSLQIERRKREKDLELLRTSEIKLAKELTSLKENMVRMRGEMSDFQDIEGLKSTFEKTQQALKEQRQSYIKRRDGMRQQVQGLSQEHEGLKKQLNASETAREIDDTEKRLKHYERSIFELREFVETKSRETDFEGVKGTCLKLMDSLNTLLIKKQQQPSSRASFNAGAKW